MSMDLWAGSSDRILGLAADLKKEWRDRLNLEVCGQRNQPGKEGDRVCFTDSSLPLQF
jgi:hypothetical protein